MQELSSIGLIPEDWGGDIPMVQISALQGQNVGDLLETIMVVAKFSCRFGEYLASPRRLAIDGYEGDLLLHNFWNNAIFMEQLGW
ncbi:translation initiation factor IF-2, chloroplastic [Trifolium repens]|nr:translation initiation factor IF-2, chloroplastic [Trifolium repens]